MIQVLEVLVVTAFLSWGLFSWLMREPFRIELKSRPARLERSGS